MKAKIESIKVEKIIDQNPDLSWLETEQNEDGSIKSSCRYSNEDIKKYGKKKVQKWIDQDKARLESYGQSWEMLGVMAEARVTVNGSFQTITSGGLWGVESDSQDSYFQEVGREQLADLKGQLKQLNVSLVGFKALSREALENL